MVDAAERKPGKRLGKFRTALTSSASSSTGIVEDIGRLIPPQERATFHEMLARELRSREL